MKREESVYVSRFTLHALSRFYAATYFTDRRRFLGARLSAWLQMLLIFPAFYAFFVEAWAALSLLVAVFVLLRLGYWVAGRRGYKKFIPTGERLPPDAVPLAVKEKAPVQATGTFAVAEREAYELDRAPATYWRYPLGDHVIMVQGSDGRYLYQFFRVETLEKVEPGVLVAAGQVRRALAITFRATWGPDIDDDSVRFYMRGELKERDRLALQTIYFTFNSEEERQQVWAAIAWNDLPNRSTTSILPPASQL